LPSAGTGLEDVTTVAEIAPGVSSARHSHPGEDFGYLIEGTIVQQVDGKPPRTVKAGEVFCTRTGPDSQCPKHWKNDGEGAKGKPGITPAP
jgi:uncharacterized cupin superfamily protein